jgi:hypothetical protein
MKRRAPMPAMKAPIRVVEIGVPGDGRIGAVVARNF